MFRDVTSDSQLRGLQATLNVDRDRANLLGVSMGDMRNALYTAFGERQVSSIYNPSNTFVVIMEAADNDRQFEDAFNRIYLRGKNGALVPLSSFASVQRTIGPTAVNHQGQLQAITLSFNPGARGRARTGDAQPGRLRARAEDAFEHRHQLRRRCCGVPRFARGQAILLIVAILVIYLLLGVLYESSSTR
jgi:HAE1 family hydrophobic/amphiphilic exporter-1